MRAPTPFDALFVTSFTSALLSGCGGASTGDGIAPAGSSRSEAPFDPCKESAPLAKTYRGLLKDARCDQDVYFRMARIAGQLGVDCTYCHAPKAGSESGTEVDYPKMTEMKQRALFMGHAFLDGLARKDKKEIQCAHCHVDKGGKPAARFLGTPRDKAFTLDWMNLRMVNDFTTKDGQKLKCKHCHVAAYGMPGFEPKVILGEGNPSLPGVPPFVRFGEGVEVPPSSSAAPSADPSAAPVVPPTATAAGVPPSSASPSPPPSASAATPSATTPPLPAPKRR